MKRNKMVSIFAFDADITRLRIMSRKADTLQGIYLLSMLDSVTCSQLRAAVAAYDANTKLEKRFKSQASRLTVAFSQGEIDELQQIADIFTDGLIPKLCGALMMLTA